MAEESENFDLSAVARSFKACKREDNSISLDEYIIGYTEVCKLFSLLGTVFGFVSKDVVDKIEILHKHKASGAGPNYITVQSMVNYEIENKITKTKGSIPSGCRTLLRLHRALEFIILFMEKIVSEKESALSVTAHESYSNTLSKHHVWLVRKAVGVAMYTLPTREMLLNKMGQTSIKETEALIQEVIRNLKPVYSIVQTVYQENDILDLP